MLSEEVKQKLIESTKNINILYYKETVDEIIRTNDIDKKTRNYNLLGLVSYESLELIKFVLSLGADINNNCNEFGKTSLMIVSLEENFEAINYLISKGADINITDSEGWSALTHVCRWGLTEVAKVLISLGADVNVITSDFYDKRSILQISIEEGNLELIKLLVENGANINYIDKMGNTALMHAAWYGKEDIVTYLISKGARLDVYNNDGKTALTIAKEGDYANIVDILSPNSPKMKTKEEIEEELKESTESFNKLVKKLTF